MKDIFNEHRRRSMEKRAKNREASPQILKDAGVPYEERNSGIHLIVSDQDGGLIDFWPGTGLWTVRATGKRARGVFKLIEHVTKGRDIFLDVLDERAAKKEKRIKKLTIDPNKSNGWSPWQHETAYLGGIKVTRYRKTSR